MLISNARSNFLFLFVEVLRKTIVHVFVDYTKKRKYMWGRPELNVTVLVHLTVFE